MSGDLAGNVGWAYGFPGDEPQYGSHRFAPPGCALGPYLAKFADWFDALVAINQPRLIVYEATIHTDGETAIETARKLMGIAGRAEEIAHRRGIRVEDYGSSTVCKWFTGNGSHGGGEKKKQAVMRACVALNWKPDDYDQSDALALWSYACSIFAPKTPERRWLGPLLGATA